jgi:RNA polymerase-binding transcription factor DksA
MISEAEVIASPHRLLALMRRLDRDRTQLEDEALRPAGGEASGGLSDVPLHLADLGSHGFEEELTLGLLQTEEQLIEEINAALDRLDRGVYGRRESCGREVSKERLQALPYARHCVACARNLQRKASP